jgi:hypothetical protein
MRRRDLLVLVSGMMAAPHLLRAQQKAMPVGFLSTVSRGPNAPFTPGVPTGTERNRLCRGAERGDRIPLGR